MVGGEKCTWGPSYWCASNENAEKCGAGVCFTFVFLCVLTVSFRQSNTVKKKFGRRNHVQPLKDLGVNEIPCPDRRNVRGARATGAPVMKMQKAVEQGYVIGFLVL